MILRIIDAEYIKDYILKIEFSDGVVKIVDLKPYLTGPVHGQLLDHNRFVQYGLKNDTIEWSGEIDFAPEFFYDKGVEVEDKECRDTTKMQRFFRSHREINIAGLAERLGLNPKLLTSYINGHKTPSKEREALICAGVREMGRELAEVSF